MITYKINVLEELIKAGYTTYLLRKRNYLSETTISNLRKGKPITMDALNAVCCMLHKRPQDIIDFVVSDEEKIKYYI